LDLKSCSEEGLWKAHHFDSANPFLLLIKLDREICLTKNCILQLIEPNHIRVKLLNEEKGLIKFLYSSGWSADGADVLASKGEMGIPWLAVKGRKDSVIDLVYSA
jgi:hypothetical protein